MAVVAAFVFEDKLPSYQLQQVASEAESTSSSGEIAMLHSLQTPAESLATIQSTSFDLHSHSSSGSRSCIALIVHARFEACVWRAGQESAAGMDWSWVLQRRRRQRRKVLAGFVRATGDVTLTASIWDLAIHPELQGLGLGRRLLAKISNQVGCLLRYHC